MIKNKKLLILGCGWVGKITADLFLQNNFEVWGTTTQENNLTELEQNGISPILLDLLTVNNKNQGIEDLLENVFDLIIISIPVKRNESTDLCLKKFNKLIELLTKINYKQIIYLSSIGVYEPVNGIITEDSKVNEKGNIFIIQDLLSREIPSLITLRLGGLFGFGRIPGKYFSNKVCTVGQEKANYIHGTDVANVIFEISKRKPNASTYNVVAQIHPLKKDTYEAMAKKYNFPPVLYSEETNIQKEVSSEKLILELDYTFKIPSPLDF